MPIKMISSQSIWGTPITMFFITILTISHISFVWYLFKFLLLFVVHLEFDNFNVTDVFKIQST
jgi:hypothetical protein